MLYLLLAVVAAGLLFGLALYGRSVRRDPASSIDSFRKRLEALEPTPGPGGAR